MRGLAAGMALPAAFRGDGTSGKGISRPSRNDRGSPSPIAVPPLPPLTGAPHSGFFPSTSWPTSDRSAIGPMGGRDEMGPVFIDFQPDPSRLSHIPACARRQRMRLAAKSMYTPFTVGKPITSPGCRMFGFMPTKGEFRSHTANPRVGERVDAGSLPVYLKAPEASRPPSGARPPPTPVPHEPCRGMERQADRPTDSLVGRKSPSVSPGELPHLFTLHYDSFTQS